MSKGPRAHPHARRHRVAELIQTGGAARLLLPPYSPDLNPIKQAFSKLKALLWRATERTVIGLWDPILQFGVRAGNKSLALQS